MRLVTTLAPGGPFSRDDLAGLPADGHRYELIDGALLVTPAPSIRHQIVSGRLYSILDAARPASLLVLCAPVDVVLRDDTVVQPDLLVARRMDFTADDLPTAPLLAIEILSPTTRLIDLNLKRARYQAAGCSSYWVVDPDIPTLTAWELRNGRYVEIAHATGNDAFEATAPYSVRIIPAELVQ
jgi:Uma2 family endonuclease